MARRVTLLLLPATLGLLVPWDPRHHQRLQPVMTVVGTAWQRERRRRNRVSIPLTVGTGLETDVLCEGDFVVHYSRGICIYAGRYGEDGKPEERPVLLRFADRVVAVEVEKAVKDLTLLKRGTEYSKGDERDVNDKEVTGITSESHGVFESRRNKNDPDDVVKRYPRYDQKLATELQLEKGQQLDEKIDEKSTPPTLSKVSKSSPWRARRNKAIAASREHARELLTTSAARQQRTRDPCDPLEAHLDKLLNDGLGFELTPGQKACLADVEEDLCRRTRPMDRLVFGDVGFGKTEVALRAIATAVQAGRQAAIVAPTTILASQHKETLQRRLAPLNMTVELCIGMQRGKFPSNRTTKVEAALEDTTKRRPYKRVKPRKPSVDRRSIRQRIASGDVDVVVGTHAILSDRQFWPKLGLAVIDEEQRFGVAQKEKLKNYCADLDVLSLSATPIPRTLAGALTGIKDVSELPAPPDGRGQTTTLVFADESFNPIDDQRLRGILTKERARGGQTFYVVPYVADVQDAVARVSRTLGFLDTNDEVNDEAWGVQGSVGTRTVNATRHSEEVGYHDPRILVAHGRCRDPASVIDEFAKGDNETAPVLVATTLVENGLDLPRVNTIVVQDAHRFGLATLHQLRGRVGRGAQDAYCVLLHPRENAMTIAARKRLEAMMDENSSGPDLARRDLEIRGAGEIFGTRQSGRATRYVGGRLYAKILRQEIERLRAFDVKSVETCTVSSDVIDLAVDDDDFAAALANADTDDAVKALAPLTKGDPGKKLVLKRTLLERYAACLGFENIGLFENDGVILAKHIRPETWKLLKRQVPESLRASLRFDEPNASVLVVRLAKLKPPKRVDFLLEILLHMTNFLQRTKHIHDDNDDDNVLDVGASSSSSSSSSSDDDDIAVDDVNDVPTE